MYIKQTRKIYNLVMARVNMNLSEVLGSLKRD